MNQNFDVVESMAVSNGKILAVGKSKDILKKYKSENIQNLDGKSVFMDLSMRIAISLVTRLINGNANCGEQNLGTRSFKN
ncbi:hypothetical protein LDL59_06120 [Kaistella anthropi]|nr:hypothetical protein [Kaistella anthropi]